MHRPERSGRDVVEEWRQLVESLVASAASAAGRPELPRDLLGAMQRQVNLVQEVIERERRLQRDITGRLVAPVDAVFDLLEETGATLRAQAEAVESASRALTEAAVLMQRQAELFERTIVAVRQPADFVKAATGLERAPSENRSRAPRTQRKAGGTSSRKTGATSSRKAGGTSSRKTGGTSSRKATGGSAPRPRA
jgi:hypothetical protein